MFKRNPNAAIDAVVMAFLLMNLVSVSPSLSAPLGLEQTVNGLASSLTSGLTNGLFGGLRNSLSGVLLDQQGSNPLNNYMNQFRAFGQANNQFPQQNGQIWPQQLQAMMNGQLGANGFLMGQLGQMNPLSPGQAMNGFSPFQGPYSAQMGNPFNPNGFNNPIGGMLG